MLRIEHLNKRYGPRSVLQNLSLYISPGEIYGLLGPNGSGKTTTINILCNLVKADSGLVKIGGQLVSEQTKYLLGVAPQENLLYKSLTCVENLNFFGQLYGLNYRERVKRIQICLAAVGLSRQANDLAGALSGGMQRRLSTAIALIHQPKLLILDEPTTGLDIEARYEIWELIRNLQSQGITILLTTHLLDEAERLCQRIGILKQGSILAEGSLAQLRRHVPATEVVVVQTPNEAGAIARAHFHQFTTRRYGNDLTFWLPRHMELHEIITCFEGIPLDSIARHPVKLEHIYLEITQRPVEKSFGSVENFAEKR